MNQETLQELLDQYITGNLSEEGKKKLLQYLNNSANDDEVGKILHQTFVSDQYLTEENPEIRSAIQNWLSDKIPATTKQGYVVRMRWWVAAASVAILLALGSLLYFSSRTHPATEQPSLAVKHDVQAPQTNRATITLANGNVVYLDSSANGQLAVQGNVQIEKTADGKVIYTGAEAGELVYNTLTNPRGSRVIDITLADGSRVWLNAGSSLTYPVAFAAAERKVTINGEGYFEVAHNAAKPFSVTKGDMQVLVLGTHFNVNAYDDEQEVKVTLLEGSVSLSQRPGAVAVKLKPGQQAVGSSYSQFTIHNSPDLEQVMAWKDGWFEFNQMDLRAIMRQVSRWYNVNIFFKGQTNEKFGGRLSKALPLSAVIEMMNANGVECSLDGNTLEVKPK